MLSVVAMQRIARYITNKNTFLLQTDLELGTLKDVERSLKLMGELTVNVHNWAISRLVSCNHLEDTIR